MLEAVITFLAYIAESFTGSVIENYSEQDVGERVQKTATVRR